MSSNEWRFGLEPVYPDVISGMDKIEEEGPYNHEWLSPDGKRKLVVTVMGGGPEWEGVWLKDIRLIATDSIVSGELMRLQYVKNKDVDKVNISIFIDVLNYDLNLESYGYSLDSGGVREEVGCIKIPCLDETKMMDAYANEAVVKDIRLLSELPQSIDVEETALLFIEQLEDRNFTLPVLIPE